MRLIAAEPSTAPRILRLRAYLVVRQSSAAEWVSPFRYERELSAADKFAVHRRGTIPPANPVLASGSLASTRRRLLSLDFDGVLHPGPQIATRLKHFCWLPDLSSLLESHEDVDVVVHSTWRYEYDDHELRELLGPLGRRYVGAAPHGQRYEALRWWLSQNPAYAEYRILDDDVLEFPTPPPPELIWCPPDAGVTATQVRDSLQRWLDGNEAPA